MSALHDHNVVDPRNVKYRLRPIPLLTVGWWTCVESPRNSKNLSLYMTPIVPPREGTRPTTSCRPGPLTRRRGFMSSCIERVLGARVLTTNYDTPGTGRENTSSRAPGLRFPESPPGKSP